MFQRSGLGWDGCWCAVGLGWGCDSVGWWSQLERASGLLEKVLQSWLCFREAVLPSVWASRVTMVQTSGFSGSV